MKIRISLVPLGLALEHVLSVVRAVAAWGRCPRKTGQSLAAYSPSGACTRFHRRCLQAVLKSGMGSRQNPHRLLQLQAGRVRLGGKSLSWTGGSPETMTGRLIWLWCCSVLQAPGFCPFSPLQEQNGEGGGSLLITACKYNSSMHRSARGACLLHPMCCD